MLSCMEVATRASALIDGELGLWSALQMRLHLAMCKGCTRFIAQMRVTRDLAVAADLAAHETDDAGIDALLAQLHAGTQSGAETP